ncbi:hypothetical protein NQ317_004649 [Molorchus minor]|uniref:Uncharacterized protein n=1 Tax=Molorchus minor TaxID=1323400 RepID=A0ABQ9J6G4_9CUCU|nr:hypothetical protein NQ317_004649 [Molorchus minor]
MFLFTSATQNFTLIFVILRSFCELDTYSFIAGGGGDTTKVDKDRIIEDKNQQDGSSSNIYENMSVCFEASNVLASQVGTSSSSQLLENSDSISHTHKSSNTTVANVIQQPITANISQPPITSTIVQPSTDKLEPVSTTKGVAKLVVANHPSVNSCNQVLQKVNSPLITVLNPSGPLTVVKTLCVTSGVSSTPQFTLVNSSPLNVTNAVGKSPTITLLNAPVVVKAITTQSIDKTA